MLMNTLVKSARSSASGSSVGAHTASSRITLMTAAVRPCGQHWLLCWQAVPPPRKKRGVARWAVRDPLALHSPPCRARSAVPRRCRGLCCR